MRLGRKLFWAVGKSGEEPLNMNVYEHGIVADSKARFLHGPASLFRVYSNNRRP